MAFVSWMCSPVPSTQQHFTLYKSFQREQALRARHSKCSTSISQEKGMFPEKTKCIWFPLTIKAWCPFISFFPAVKKRTAESCRIQPANTIPSPTPPDIKMVTFTPTLPSPPPQICEFLFLVYCFASHQSLHVFPWKPFCLLSIFLHYLPFALCFSICLFFLPLFNFVPLSSASPLYSSPILPPSLSRPVF